MGRNTIWAECAFWDCAGTAPLEIKDNKCTLIVNSTYDACFGLAVAQTGLATADQEVSVIWSWTCTVKPADWYVWLHARRNTATCGGYEAGYNFYEARVIREYNGPGDRAQLLKRLGGSMTVIANITYTVASGSVVKLTVDGTHIMLTDDGGLAAEGYDSDIASGSYVALGLAWWDENYSGGHSDMVIMADDFCANNI